MLDVEIDTLVLGCTHYPLLKHIIQDVVGGKVKLIDSGEETAKEAVAKMTESNLLNPQAETDFSAVGEHGYFVSDVPERFEKVASRFLGQVVDNITRVDISKY